MKYAIILSNLTISSNRVLFPSTKNLDVALSPAMSKYSIWKSNPYSYEVFDESDIEKQNTIVGSSLIGSSL